MALEGETIQQRSPLPLRTAKRPGTSVNGDGRPASLQAQLNAKRNSLNALRLLLAAAVIVSHTWPLGGYGSEPEIGGLTLGRWAVVGFFGISGYLITASRYSGKSARSYYQARFLRIFPAFFVCLVVIAFLAAPLAGRFGPGSYSLHSALTYVVKNIALYPPKVAQAGIGTTLAGTPYDGNTWDGSLWTLFWEAICYIAVGIAGSTITRRTMGFVSLGAVLVATLVLALKGAGFLHVPGLASDALLLLSAFASGAAIYVYRGRVSSSWTVGLVCAVLLSFSCVLGRADTIAQLPFTLLLLILGARLPLSAIGRRNDVSYGLYIYGAVVQQIVSLATRGHRLPIILYLLTVIVGTTILAWASWLLIEKPALRRKQ